MKLLRVFLAVLILGKFFLIISGTDAYITTQIDLLDSTDVMWLLAPFVIVTVLFCAIIVLDNAYRRGAINRRLKTAMKVVIVLIPLSGLLVMPVFHRLGR
ncbi:MULTISPECIES: hypothetical protein [unclassified Flavobacterium]|uniref:hypothetical protein n=1 Tax=unclassified Flavobacterium TaxID=196869 RepID=UPI001F13FF85|nr:MULTISPECIES: hypothetical protein [unclassified Flavobacterium]UMY66335.1 hypothetical protein MKO97_02850 [Flavobacterium sp. HJ-32-4]